MACDNAWDVRVVAFHLLNKSAGICHVRLERAHVVLGSFRFAVAFVIVADEFEASGSELVSSIRVPLLHAAVPDEMHNQGLRRLRVCLVSESGELDLFIVVGRNKRKRVDLRERIFPVFHYRGKSLFLNVPDLHF